jgi:hypothetical protein
MSLIANKVMELSKSRMFEVAPDTREELKKVVTTLRDERDHGILNHLILSSRGDFR